MRNCITTATLANLLVVLSLYFRIFAVGTQGVVMILDCVGLPYSGA
jgi:hypothetical protein